MSISVHLEKGWCEKNRRVRTAAGNSDGSYEGEKLYSLRAFSLWCGLVRLYVILVRLVGSEQQIHRVMAQEKFGEGCRIRVMCSVTTTAYLFIYWSGTRNILNRWARIIEGFMSSSRHHIMEQAASVSFFRFILTTACRHDFVWYLDSMTTRNLWDIIVILVPCFEFAAGPRCSDQSADGSHMNCYFPVTIYSLIRTRINKTAPPENALRNKPPFLRCGDVPSQTLEIDFCLLQPKEKCVSSKGARVMW